MAMQLLQEEDSHLGFLPHRGRRGVMPECPAQEAMETMGHAPCQGAPAGHLEGGVPFRELICTSLS